MWVDARVAIKKLPKSLISSTTILSSITLKTFSAAPMDSFFPPRSFQITIELYSNNVALLVFAAATASVQLTCFSKMHPDAFPLRATCRRGKHLLSQFNRISVER